MTTKHNQHPKDDTEVTDVNQIINSDNTQPDYYTGSLNQDHDSTDQRTTSAISGLEEVSDEGTEEMYQSPATDDLDELADPQDIDGPNITTDTARYTDEGGVVDGGTDEVFSQDNASANAGAPGHWGIDEDTE